MENIALVNRRFRDLNPLIIGQEQCLPGHSFGPAVRNYTLIHFVDRGTGFFCKNGTRYSVGAGEAFLILPDEITTYYASEDTPWQYHWIGFDGALTERFTSLPPVFAFSRNWASEMLSTYQADEKMSEYRVTALLFQMFADFFAVEKPNHHYVRKVKDYILALYMKEIRVEEIARQLNLDRRYLSRLFKEKTGKTIQEYLILVRMEAAKKQLERGASVAEAAQLCGYEDVCNFSKMFKRMYGISPGKWGKQVSEDFVHDQDTESQKNKP